jgi:hypothetical protein
MLPYCRNFISLQGFTAQRVAGTAGVKYCTIKCCIIQWQMSEVQSHYVQPDPGKHNGDITIKPSAGMGK